MNFSVKRCNCKHCKTELEWIFAILSFVLSFIFLLIVIFEFSFRVLTADNVIDFMSKLEFLGFKVSFDSWFIFLVLLSFLGALVVSGMVLYKLQRIKR